MANSAFEIAVEAYVAEHGAIDDNTYEVLKDLYMEGSTISAASLAKASKKLVSASGKSEMYSEAKSKLIKIAKALKTILEERSYLSKNLVRTIQSAYDQTEKELEEVDDQLEKYRSQSAHQRATQTLN